MKPVYDRMVEVLLEAGKKSKGASIPVLLAKVRVKRTGPSKEDLEKAAEESGSARAKRLEKRLKTESIVDKPSELSSGSKRGVKHQHPESVAGIERQIKAALAKKGLKLDPKTGKAVKK